MEPRIRCKRYLRNPAGAKATQVSRVDPGGPQANAQPAASGQDDSALSLAEGPPEPLGPPSEHAPSRDLS